MELALRAFPKEALNPLPFYKIKSFEDAVTVLGMNVDDVNSIVNTLKETSKAMIAMYKLNIVRKALNLGNDLYFTEESKDSEIYCPYNSFVTENSTFFKKQINLGEMEIIGKIKVQGILYNVLSGNAVAGIRPGLGCFSSFCGIGDAYANIAFLGCANEDIAKHFSKYFGMLITEAKFGDLQDFEITKDKYGNS